LGKNIIIKKYEKNFHDKISEIYDLRRVSHPRFQYHYRRIAWEIYKKYSKKIDLLLDIGCGSGGGLLQFIGYAHNLIGFDLSFKLLKILKRKIDQYKTLRGQFINLIQGDAAYLPFKKKKFNLITFWGTIHHIPDKSDTIKEAKDKLIKNGFITMHEPNMARSRIPRILDKVIDLIFLNIRRENIVFSTKKVRIKNEFSKYEQELLMKDCIKILKKNDLQIILKKTVWYFGTILLNFPSIFQKLFYLLIGKLDILTEKIFSKNGAAIFIISLNN